MIGLWNFAYFRGTCRTFNFSIDAEYNPVKSFPFSSPFCSSSVPAFFLLYSIDF